MMTLKRFRVTNFRSIMDSGWIECDNVTSLVGINEAGKSNVILALWKLKPVRDGQIDLLHDMPTKEYSSWRSTPEDVVFISADFELNNALIDKVVALCKCDRDVVAIVNIKRRYDGRYDVSFPCYKSAQSINAASIVDSISILNNQLKSLKEKTKAEAGIKERVSTFYSNVLTFISSKDVLTQSDFAEIEKMCPTGLTKSATSEIYPNFQAAQAAISNGFSDLNPSDPADNADIQNLMVSEMPSFVYYSNYGNLDAQIYLPHAIKWLNGEEVAGIDNSAKVRTLRVLFDFVKLNPQEVLDLGKDPVEIVVDNYGRESKRTPTTEEIERATAQKAERAILLNSASTDLTRKFKEWW